MRQILATLCLGTGLAGCAALGLDPAKGPITNELSFRDLVVGKALTRPDVEGLEIVINPDGSLDGRLADERFTGRWRWQDIYWCRSIDLPNETGEECQLLEITAEGLQVTRDQGAGESTLFVLSES